MTKLNQSGAISMLTVIFLALLLTIITTSFVRLSVTEQRQAVDDDLTTRAFYAAESGIEDAKRAISDFQAGGSVDLNESECTPADVVSSGVLSADLDTEYTCQLIDMSPANFQSSLEAWQAVTVPLRGASAFNSVLIEWHIDSGTDYNLRNNSELLTMDSWNLPPDDGTGPHPAMLRAALFSHQSATFDAGEIQDNAVAAFLNPEEGSGGTSLGAMDGDIIPADCDPPSSSPSNAYACSVEISGIDSNRTNYLRLQALYTSTNVQITLLNNNVPVLLDDVQAVVDVTGRAGDVYRRVEARISLLTEEYPLPDIALWSNTEICKAFTVTDDPADYDTSACPWQP